MLTKRFMDIFLILAIILAASLFFYQTKYSQDIFADDSLGTFEERLALAQDYYGSPLGIFLSYAPRILLGLIYLFVLILAIQMHKKGWTSTLDTVWIAIFAPFAFVFYFVTLRKHYKKSSMPQT